MDADRFDTLARTLTTAGSRRHALALTLGGTLALLLAGNPAEAHDALLGCKKKSGKQKKKCVKKAKQHNGAHASELSQCSPNCSGKECGDNGCGGTCGGCADGTCGSSGRCVCPAGTSCRPGVCCPQGQSCNFGSCEACQLGSSPCAAKACGRSGGPLPCACATSIENVAYCIAATTPGPLHCFGCTTDEQCDTELDVPAGSAVCIGVGECACEGTLGRACAPKCTGT